MHERTNLVVAEYRSMVRRSALWASFVRASASSRNMTLKSASPKGAMRAKSLTLWRMISMPRSSLAFSSMKLFLQLSPKISLTMEIDAAVLPTPGGPENRRCGRFLVLT